MSFISFLFGGAVSSSVIFSFFLFISFKTRFVGIRKIFRSVKTVFSRSSQKGLSPVKAACVSLSATVGTGNIVGVAGAVTLGGPGAVFWMWVSGLLALSVKFSEIYISSLYKAKGGAFAYVDRAFDSKLFKTLFPILGIITAFGIGNLTQTNAAANSGAFLVMNICVSSQKIRIIIGVVFCVLSLIFLKRTEKAVKFCSVFLPFMAIGYISLCVFALFRVRNVLPEVFGQIIKGAFCPRAVTGGAVGSVLRTVKSGLARGMFSNEAGLSTSALAYENSRENGFKLSLFGIFEVIVDTLVLCTVTALVVISSGTAVYGKDLGAYTTLLSFMNILGQKWTFVFCVMICFFAISSVIGWGIYLRRFAEYLKISPLIAVFLYSFACIFGAVFRADTVWKIAEAGSFLMTALNCTAIAVHQDKISYKNLKKAEKNKRF